MLVSPGVLPLPLHPGLQSDMLFFLSIIHISSSFGTSFHSACPGHGLDNLFIYIPSQVSAGYAHWIFQPLFFILCARGVLLATWVPWPHGGQQRSLMPWDLSYIVFVSCFVGARNWLRAFWRSTQLLTMSRLQPQICSFSASFVMFCVHVCFSSFIWLFSFSIRTRFKNKFLFSTDIFIFYLYIKHNTIVLTPSNYQKFSSSHI